MSNAVVGALRANLGLDSAAFDKGIAQARSALGRFGAAAQAGLARAGLAFAGFAATTAYSLNSTRLEIDALAKQARSMGLPVEELSRFKLVAELSGATVEQFGVSLNKLSQGLNEIATKEGAPAERALRSMGIAARDTSGKLKSANAVLEEVADRFASYADGTNKTALAIALFGEQGTKLIPMLNAGAKGIRDMKKESDELGATIGPVLAKRTEALNDNITRLTAAWNAGAKDLLGIVLPAMTRLTDALVEQAKESKKTSDTIWLLGGALKGIGIAALLVKSAFDGISFAIRNMAEAGTALLEGRLADALKNAGIALLSPLKAMETWEAGTKALAEEGANRLGGFAASAEKAAATVGDSWGKKAAPALAAATQHLRDFNRATQEQLEKLQLESRLLGATEGAKAVANRQLELEIMLRKERLKLSPAEREDANRRIEALGRQAAATDLARRRWEMFTETMDAFRNAFTSSIDKLIDGTFKLKDALADLLKQFAKMLANQAFINLFGDGRGQQGAFNVAGMFGGFFGGARAEGGPVAPGKAYLVGERGPELIMPRAMGTVVPTEALGSAMGGLSMPITINAPGADAAGLSRVEAEIRRLRAEIPGMAVKAYANARDRRMVR